MDDGSMSAGHRHSATWMMDRLRSGLPRLVLSPSFLIVLFFVYGFILWTTYLSFSSSTFLPSYEWVGLRQWGRLWRTLNWEVALWNLLIFGVLYIAFSTAIGLLLAIFLDQKIRIEGVLRPIYLYPMALSFIVVGTAWKWFLNPGLGLQNTVRSWGWESFTFDWLVDPKMAIYTVVMAGVWQSSGFVMAMFLAGLRGIDDEILKAARIDGASGFRLYWRVILPQLRLAFFSVLMILTHLAIKSYDLVVALTNGGPGNATQLPSTFMYSYTFGRNQMGVGSASAVFMLTAVAVVVVPYVYFELKRRR